MGKSLPSPAKLQNLTRLTSEHIKTPKSNKPRSTVQLSPQFRKPFNGSDRMAQKMDAPERRERRVPLADVVADCVKRWFQDTLKEAKAGDSSMQVLVGQMYYSGYGVGRDAQKVLVSFFFSISLGKGLDYKSFKKSFICLEGYNASDSDSDEANGDAKQ